MHAHTTTSAAIRAGAAVATAAALVLLSGCAGALSPTAAPSGVPAATRTETAFDPDATTYILVRAGDDEVRLGSSGWALPSDEAFPTDRPTLTGNELYIFTPQQGWTVTATAYTGTSAFDCGTGRSFTPPAEDLGDGWTRVDAAGPAGDYVLDIVAGSGPGLPAGGTEGATDTQITWTTTESTAWPNGGASFDVSDNDGGTATVGVSITGLAETPTDASATATVTGSTGSRPVDLVRDDGACPEAGTLSFTGTLAASALTAVGAAPYSAEVSLTLDGKIYTGTSDNGINLTFTPALP